MKKNLLKKLTLLSLGGIGFFSPTFAQTCPSWGPYIESYLGGVGDELVYNEVMAESAGMVPGTYYLVPNFTLGPRGGYAGIQYKQNNIRNNIFSVWDVQDSNVAQCTAEYAAPNTLVGGFANEGTGLHTDNPMPWTPGVWYASVVRRWSVGDGKTRVGYFMYDYGTGIWKHYVTIVTPENDAKLIGDRTGGFLENFMGTVNQLTRWGYYRNFRSMNSEGKWFASDVYNIAAGTGSWTAAPAFNNTAIKVTSCGMVPGPQSLSFSLTPQSAKPATTVPATVTSVKQVYNRNANTLDVTWTIDDTKSPQLSYTVNFYSQSSWNNGYTPIATVSGIRPDTRKATVTLSANLPSGKYYASVVVKDIFNQTSNFGYSMFDLNIAQSSTYYRIKSVASGQYITPQNFSTASGTKMVQQPLSNNLNQQWWLTPAGDNYWISNRATGLVLEVPGSNITSGTTLTQNSWTNTNNQQWVLKPYTAGSSFIIGTALSNLKAIDLPAGSTVAGTNINIWDQDINGTAGVNHQWILEPVTPSTAAKTIAAESNIATAQKEITSTKVYPNPAKQSEDIHLDFPDQEAAYTLIIVNAGGSTILKTKISPKFTLSTANLVKGVYYYTAESNGKQLSGKFLVQ